MMKRFKYYIGAVAVIFFLGSCDLQEIDNYAWPDANIYGGIYDVETGELVEQDIINGMQIEFVEQGFENPEIQRMVVRNDGTYRNNLIFAATYAMRPVRGNFVPVEEQLVEVKGDFMKNFVVQPYIRIKNATIERQGNKVVATFNLQQTVTNKVVRIGLFAHQEMNVGANLSSASATLDVNAVTNDVTLYRLEINLDAYSSMQAGDQYYFRVGALIDATEAKYNYAPAVRLTL